MAVLLKILCFVIWMIIMLVLIHGSHKKKPDPGQLVRIQVTEEDDVEVLLRRAMQEINHTDRLIIEDISSRHRYNRIKVAAMGRKNPSILYYTVREN